MNARPGFFDAPAAKLVHIEQGTQVWLDWRDGKDLPDGKPRITGTLAAIISGNSIKKITPYQQWAEMTGRKKPEEASEYLRKLWAHGQKLEPVARAAYEEHTFNEVRPICVEHPLHPWAAASLDGLTGSGDVPVEIKCPVSQKKHDMAKAGIVPPEYIGQVVWQLFVLPKAKELHFWSYFPNDKDGIKGALVVVQRDQAMEDLLFKKCLDFRISLVKDTPPVGDDWAAAARGYREAKAAFDEAQEALRQWEGNLIEMLPAGDKSYEGGGVKVTRYPRKGSVDWERAMRSLGRPDDEVQAAMEASREPGPVNFPAALASLGVEPNAIEQMSTEFATDGKMSHRITMTALADETESLEPEKPQESAPLTDEVSPWTGW